MNSYLFALIIVSTLFISYGIFSFIFYNNRKNAWANEALEVANQMQGLIKETPTLDIEDRVTATRELLHLIDIFISYEIINKERNALFLESNDKAHIDVDVRMEEVANEVFRGIRPDVYDDNNNLITRQYLISYIQKRTIVEYLNYVRRDIETQLENAA